MEQGKNKNSKGVKKTVKVLLIILSILVVLIAAACLFGIRLLGRLSRPDTGSASTPEPTVTVADTPAQDEAPHMTPTPTRTPELNPVETPAVTEPPLPLSEYYVQTPLTEAQKVYFDGNNSYDESKYINILLIGADRRALTGSYNSDVMMIATVDKVNGRLKLTSLMRDMLVLRPGYGYGKLNSCVAKGGMELLFDTIYQNFNLKIDKYVMVDMHTFVEVIDAMDGIVIDMTAEEISSANDNIAGLNKQYGIEDITEGFIYAPAGPVQLTGTQALGYARIRHLDSEFKRVERQYEVLSMVFAKFMEMGVGEQYDLMYDMLPMIETNLSNTEILDIGISALKMNERGILYNRLPVKGMFENGKWEKKFVFFCDMPAMSIELHKFIFDSAEKPVETMLLTPNPSAVTVTPAPTGGGGIIIINGSE